MKNVNVAVGEKNCLDLSVEKRQLVHPFRRQECWKFIGCILSAVTYGKKGHNIWGGAQISVDKQELTKSYRYVCRNTDLLRVLCGIYRPQYCYACH